MTNNKNREKAARQPSEAPNARSQLQPAGDVKVTYAATPPKGSPDKQIHPRLRLPEVRRGSTRKPEDK